MQLSKEDFLTSKRNRPYLKDPVFYKLSEVRGVVVHWTANTDSGANARANRNYFNTTQMTASAHYVVDESGAIQCIPEDEVAYHVGAKSYKKEGIKIMGSNSKNPNHFTIGVEMCVNSDGLFINTWVNTVLLVRDILARHDLPLSRLYRHYDITGKDCPKFLINENNWNTFKEHVAKGLPWEREEQIKKEKEEEKKEGVKVRDQLREEIRALQAENETLSSNIWKAQQKISDMKMHIESLKVLQDKQGRETNQAISDAVTDATGKLEKLLAFHKKEADEARGLLEEKEDGIERKNKELLRERQKNRDLHEQIDGLVKELKSDRTPCPPCATPIVEKPMPGDRKGFRAFFDFILKWIK